MPDPIERFRSVVGAAPTWPPIDGEGRPMKVVRDSYAQLADRLARLIAEPGTVEKLAKIIDPSAFTMGTSPHITARAHQVIYDGEWERREQATKDAEAILAFLASSALRSG